MVFSSVLFLFRFLPVFMICYVLAPRRMKNVILLLGSLLFYAWGEPVYVLLMLFSTVSDYIHGRLIDRYRKTPVARIFLVSSISINLLMLGFFKYADFMIQVVNTALGLQMPLLNLPLPVGISFYTFQTMSYSIDVYRGKAKVQKNLLDFGVFVTMFPQLIAGPIVTYRQVEEQLRERRMDIGAASRGIRRFIVGLAKKVLLANNLGVLWTEISGMDYGQLDMLGAWLGITAFAFQIYFDFSGYSDMAIGLGTVMGFHFPENFNYPYSSTSITEFWRRWHITLGSWFREYVYIPLGGNRKGIGRQIRNILIVWALTGIWHGAGFNFLLWGLWFGGLLILEKIFPGNLIKRLPGAFGWVYTQAAVWIGWVFFAIETPGEIFEYLRAMFGISQAGIWKSQSLYQGSQYVILLLIAAAAAMPVAKRLERRISSSLTAERIILVVLLLVSVAYVVEGSYNPFLYFRF